MITLYELHWSHYCEKIRLALNYLQLPWQAVQIDAFSKRELRAFPLPGHLPNYTVPAIHDSATDAFTIDSTPILRYLDANHARGRRLFPGDAANCEAIDRALLELDTHLGLLARRFAYTQVILECPALLADLFLGHRAWGLYTWPVLRHVSGAFLGMLLMQRFEFHRSEALYLYEALEAHLLRLARQLEQREFVVGSVFSAADLALAAQLRPLSIVPFFAEHAGLAALFARSQDVLEQWSGESQSAYQSAVAQARTRRPPVRRIIRDVEASMPFDATGKFAVNDQNAIWNRSAWLAPWHYCVSLRRNKRRAELASAMLR